MQQVSSREVSTSSTTCLFGLRSADGRFTGTVRVFLLGSSDEQKLRDELEQSQCYGTADQIVTTLTLQARKACTDLTQTKVLTRLTAIAGQRYTAVDTDLTGQPQSDLVAYSRQVRLHTAEQALTTPAED